VAPEATEDPLELPPQPAIASATREKIPAASRA
jgi:hypothetical protein